MAVKRSRHAEAFKAKVEAIVDRSPEAREAITELVTAWRASLEFTGYKRIAKTLLGMGLD